MNECDITNNQLWKSAFLLQIKQCIIDYFCLKGISLQLPSHLHFKFVLLFIFGAGGLLAQERISTEAYIEIYKDVAIKKMKEYKIPASITLAQGILESGSGNSSLARKANNHFGIKCHKGWSGKTYIMDDDEKNECFRKYKHAADSYRDHSLFLTQRGRYSFLFEYDITDYKKWALGLKKAGYATNPKYPDLLIRIIERHNLDQYDKKGGKGKVKDKEKDTDIHEQIFIAPDISGFANAGISPKGRTLLENNGKKLIVVIAGDTFYGIAEEFDIYSWQLYKYNELSKKHLLQIGELIYLEKKKRKAEKKYKFHTVSENESIQEIAQLYGIRLQRLYKMNKMEDGEELNVGSTLKLR